MAAFLKIFGQVFFTYFLVPVFKYTVGWFWDYYQLKKEVKVLREENAALIKKFKEANGENSLDAFGNLK